MPKQILTAKMEGRRKRGGPVKRWEEEVEEDLNIMGIKKKQVGNDRRPTGLGGGGGSCVRCRRPQRTAE
jgi:hypothetical protein